MVSSSSSEPINIHGLHFFRRSVNWLRIWILCVFCCVVFFGFMIMTKAISVCYEWILNIFFLLLLVHFFYVDRVCVNITEWMYGYIVYVLVYIVWCFGAGAVVLIGSDLLKYLHSFFPSSAFFSTFFFFFVCLSSSSYHIAAYNMHIHFICWFLASNRILHSVRVCDNFSVRVERLQIAENAYTATRIPTHTHTPLYARTFVREWAIARARWQRLPCERTHIVRSLSWLMRAREIQRERPTHTRISRLVRISAMYSVVLYESGKMKEKKKFPDCCAAGVAAATTTATADVCFIFFVHN